MFLFSFFLWRFCLKIVFIALFFLNEWTLLNDENKIKSKYMKSWEKDKMADNKRL